MELLDLALVTPPWLPLAIVIVLLGLIAFLYWSLQRNLKRIDLDDSSVAAESPTSPPAS